jgi:hypothetical protein
VHGAIDGLQRTGELPPPLVELGPAAACALARYDSTAFGPEYKNHLFSIGFNLRKVMRHELEPLGSTYRAKNSDFLVPDNADSHPTDVLEDADGGLLVVDTGGWYKICSPTSQLAKPAVLGGIYRIRRAGMPGFEDARGLKLAWNPAPPKALAGRLADPRPAVRNRAVQQLATAGSFRQGFPNDAAAVRIHEHALIFALVEIADVAGTRAGLSATNPFARRAALIALDQKDGGDLQAGEVAPLLASADPVLKATASWIASQHPAWGGPLAGFFRQRLAAPALMPAAQVEL